jgi:hypothetical protein
LTGSLRETTLSPLFHSRWAKGARLGPRLGLRSPISRASRMVRYSPLLLATFTG